MKRIFYLPAAKVQTPKELKKQLAIEERWDVAFIALACAGFVFCLVVCVVAACGFEHWRHLIGL